MKVRISLTFVFIYKVCTCFFIHFLSNFIVCVAVVDKFSQTLTEDIKSDPKKIEEKFREFCKGTKSKENRFVSMSLWTK